MQMQSRQSRKEIAAEFFRTVTAGNVREAYNLYVSPAFVHHNAYFPGDRQSLLEGMEQSEESFPQKVFEIRRQLEDGDLVATHSRLKVHPNAEVMSVVHIVRFDEDDMIVEMWDIGQLIPDDSPNQNGVF